MKDFTRIIPKHHFEGWPAKLGQMALLFHEAEYQMVKKKFREAAILQVYPENLDTFLEKVNKDHLIFTPLRRSAVSDGFSILAKPVEPGKPFLWNVCLTRTYKAAQIFKEAYFKEDHRTIGRMLGYPECCIDYFIRNFPIDPCPIWVDLEGKVKGYPETNGLLRYFGPVIVPHLTCSPTCEPTREIGKIWFKVMKEINKDLADELYELLAGPVTWNSYHGVVEVETPYFVGLNNAFFILKKPRIIIWEGKRSCKKTLSQ